MKAVTIYSTPTCAYCKMAKEYFREKNVSYTEFNVAVDIERAQEMIEKSGQMGVPVIDIEGKIVIGFNKPVIDQELGLA
jgi:glutaredoxin-like YruB-family protein